MVNNKNLQNSKVSLSQNLTHTNMFRHIQYSSWLAFWPQTKIKALAFSSRSSRPIEMQNQKSPKAIKWHVMVSLCRASQIEANREVPLLFAFSSMQICHSQEFPPWTGSCLPKWMLKTNYQIKQSSGMSRVLPKRPSYLIPQPLGSLPICVQFCSATLAKAVPRSSSLQYRSIGDWSLRF